MARTLVVVLPTQCDGDYSLHQHPRLLRRCGVVTRAILTRSDLAIDGASSHPPGSVFSVPCCVVLCSVVPSTMHCCAQVCCASHASGSTIKHTLTTSPFFSLFLGLQAFNVPQKPDNPHNQWRATAGTAGTFNCEPARWVNSPATLPICRPRYRGRPARPTVPRYLYTAGLPSAKPACNNSSTPADMPVVPSTPPSTFLLK